MRESVFLRPCGFKPLRAFPISAIAAILGYCFFSISFWFSGTKLPSSPSDWSVDTSFFLHHLWIHGCWSVMSSPPLICGVSGSWFLGWRLLIPDFKISRNKLLLLFPSSSNFNRLLVSSCPLESKEFLFRRLTHQYIYKNINSYYLCSEFRILKSNDISDSQTCLKRTNLKNIKH